MVLKSLAICISVRTKSHDQNCYPLPLCMYKKPLTGMPPSQAPFAGHGQDNTM